MSFFSWLRNRKRRTPTSPRLRVSIRPRLEALEERWLPSTLTVTSARDSGHGSLRAEIAAAQSGDTIVFSPKLDGKTIKLTSGELDLTKNLTIQGPGAGKLTISGDNPSPYLGRYYTRVFEVAANTTVNLSGLTISKGDGFASVSSLEPWDGYGGGILNHGALTVSSCAFSGNFAFSDGGAIFSDGTLTVSGSTFSGNYANYGGGIANAGTATLTKNTLSNNIAQDLTSDNYNPQADGGGIFNHGTLTVSGCTVSGNDGEGNDCGCGIYNDTSGTVMVEKSSRIIGNYNADAYNDGVLYQDSTSTIGNLGGNPAVLI